MTALVEREVLPVLDAVVGGLGTGVRQPHAPLLGQPRDRHDELLVAGHLDAGVIQVDVRVESPSDLQSIGGRPHSGVLVPQRGEAEEVPSQA